MRRLLVIIIIFFAPQLFSAEGIEQGWSSFEFIDAKAHRDRPISVWTYRPKSYTPDSRILIVMHGMKRDAKSYMSAWEKFADASGTLLVGPEFSPEYYPGSTCYNLGNMFGTSLVNVNEISSWEKLCKALRKAGSKDELTPARRVWDMLPQSACDYIKRAQPKIENEGKSIILKAFNDTLKSEIFYQKSYFEKIRMPKAISDELAKKSVSHGNLYKINRWLLERALPKIVARAKLDKKRRTYWLFSSVERIFDKVRKLAANRRKNYIIYGHSAGGQFVHRLVLFAPKARYEVAIAANPGRYTMPVFDTDFSYGLRGTGVSERSLRKVFAKPFVLMVGSQDTETAGESLSKNLHSLKQGEHRLARGKKFWKTSQSEARQLGAKLAWDFKIISEVEHDNSEMAKVAAKFIAEIDDEDSNE